NGEINTLRGNVNWMFTRQNLFQSDLFGDDLKKIMPVVRMDGSDSAIFDNALELLVLSGRSLAHAMMMMMPEPWQNHETMTDEKIKHKICKERPYRMWLNENLVKLSDLAEPPSVPEPDHQTMLLRQQAFGYTFEDLRLLMAPMAESAVEAMGSMGDDAPLAVLSDKPRLLYDYFKQLFAQVTNPPI